MTEELVVYEPGDRFASISRAGEARIWQVDDNGLLSLASEFPARCCMYHSSRCQLDQPECCPSCPATPLEDVEPM